MVYCYGCGKEIHESAVTCPACGAAQKGNAGTGLKYQSYTQVPWYRKNWFAILCFFIFMPGLFLILLTGTVYYERNGQLQKYSITAKIFLLLYSLLATIGFANVITNGNHTASAPLTQATTTPSPRMQSPSNIGTAATTVVNEQANITASTLPPDIESRTVVTQDGKNPLDQLGLGAGSTPKVVFGKFVAGFEKANPGKAVIKQNGQAFIVKDDDTTILFETQGSDQIVLEKMRISGNEVEESAVPSMFSLMVLNMGADQRTAASAPPHDVEVLLKSEGLWNDKCRDGSGDNSATQKACDQRDIMFKQINAKGWCWGPDDKPESDKSWQACAKPAL
ncbi:MAG: hypothetical protein HIU89_15815 [Proteobacteria bacterium]|nr:hypothetical protein [Pseudomonadota bacterium]